MTLFLTVKEAAQRTGKSPSSIRRIIYPILQNEKHPDRGQIQPSVEDALQLRLKGENFAWRVSEDLLARAIPAEVRSDSASDVSGTRTIPGHGDGELTAMLQRELTIKNQQIALHGELIAKQMELISGLSERLREGNVLIGSLQQRLALTDGRELKPSDVIKARTVTSGRPEKGSTPPTKPEKATPPEPKPIKQKKGFFSRIFR